MEPPKYSCTLCGQQFTRKDSVSRHFQIHKGISHKCEICQMEFSQKSTLQRHKSSKHQTKMFICHICSAAFTLKDALNRHVLRHSVEKSPQLKCKTCHKVFTRLDSFQRHRESHSQVALQKCECGKAFTREDNLKRHKTTCSTPKPRGHTPKTRGRCQSQLECDVCGKQFTTKSALKRHNLVHEEKRHTCDHCGKSWSRADTLKAHVCKKQQDHQNLSDSHTPRTGTERSRKSRSNKKLTERIKKMESSPKTKADLTKMMAKSPRTRKHLESANVLIPKEKQDRYDLLDAMAQDLHFFSASIKSKRSKGATRLRQKTVAVSIGPKVREHKKVVKAAKLLKFDQKTVSKITKEKVRQRMMSGDESAFIDVVRKTCGEKIPDQWKQVICEYWESEASHPLTDSTQGEIKKKIDTNQYLCHRRHIMTKTYQEAYVDFLELYASRNRQIK